MKRSKARPSPEQLSRRERQIMDIIYRLERATASQVLEHLPDPPSYSAVRAMLRILEDKGYVCHEQEGPRYVYMATTPSESASRTALDRVVTTFFEGSVTQAVATLLDMSGKLPESEIERLSKLIEQAKKEGR